MWVKEGLRVGLLLNYILVADLCIVTNLCVYFIWGLRVRALREVFEVLSSVDALMMGKLGVRFVYTDGKVLWCCTVVAMVYLTFACCTAVIRKMGLWTVYGRLSLLNFLVIMWCVLSQFTLLNHYLVSHLEELKRLLLRRRRSSSDLEILCKIQLLLLKACDVLNTSFGHRFLTSISMAFIAMTGGMYALIFAFTNQKGLLAVVAHSWQGIILGSFVLQILNLVISCDSTSIKACIFF
jgi:hypothetical protein